MTYLFEKYELDEGNFCLTRQGERVPLEPKALRVLLLLVAARGRVVEKGEILRTVWKDTFVEETTLTRAIGLLRKQLGDDSRKPRFIETVPTIGFRFVAAVSTAEEALPAASESPEPVFSEPIPAPSKVRRVQTYWDAATVLLLVVLAGGGGWIAYRRATAARPIQSLAVLPLENLTGDPGQEYFADGMTDELITELAHIPGLRVVSRTSVMQDKGSHKPLEQTAKELGVDAIVEGSVVRAGDKVRITAQLIDARTDTHLWSHSFEGPASDIVELQDSVASEIAFGAKVALKPELRTNHRSIRPEAHDAYLRGRYFFNRRDVRQSVTYYRQAIALDPEYAAAYSGLADALESTSALGVAQPSEVMPESIAAAKRAIELDPLNAEAYSALASVETGYEWNWKGAEANLQRAVALDPNDSLKEMRFSVYLDAMNRTEEAVTHMRRALQLDPLSFLMVRHMGSVLYLARHYDESLYYLKRAGEMEPTKPNLVSNWESWVYEQQGKQDASVESDLAAMRGVTPEGVARLRATYRDAGWKGYWRARAEMRNGATGSCSPYFEGADYLRAGDRDAAFEALNRAVDERCLWVSWLKSDPLLDGARGDRRFDGLLRRANLGGL